MPTKFSGTFAVSLVTKDLVEVNDLVDNSGNISFKQGGVFGDDKVSKLTIPSTLGAGVKVEFRADDAMAKKYDFAAGGGADVDLVSALTDPQGNTVTPTKIKMIIFENRSVGNDVIVGGHATAAFEGFAGATGDKLRVAKGGGVAFLTCPGGWPVTATTADTIKLLGANEDATTACSFVVIFVVERA